MGAKIEITPAMLEAGADAYWDWESDPAKSCSDSRLVYLAEAIYRAMVRASEISDKRQV